jgi:hypothetical protein
MIMGGNVRRQLAEFNAIFPRGFGCHGQFAMAACSKQEWARFVYAIHDILGAKSDLRIGALSVVFLFRLA